MTYTALTLTPQTKQSKNTTLAAKGENLLSLSEFTNTEFGLIIENIIIKAEGRMEKSRGLSAQIDNGTTAITDALFTNGLHYYGTDDEVFVNDGTTDTLVHTMTATGVFSFAKFGDYVFVTNGTEKIGRISKTLDYDAQTANFTVGTIVTGGTSGATAIILEDSDSGAAGTLTLGQIVGTFADGELITDSVTGSADVDGTLGFTFTTITDAPICNKVFIYDQRLIAYNIQGFPSKVQWSEKFTGTNPPFTNFTTIAAPPLTTDPGETSFFNAGTVKTLTTLGAQLVALYEDGESGIRIEVIDVDGSGLRQNVLVDFQREGLGGDASIDTNIGVFYVNESGVFQMVSGGSTAQPFSKQEVKISSLFSEEFTDTLDFTEADLFYDEKNKLLLITCRKDGASFNNFLLIYNTELKAFSRRTGWYISNFYKVGNDIFGTSSITGKIFKLFDGNSDDGIDIACRIRQELTQGEIINMSQLQEVYAKGKLAPDQTVTISFDIFDSEGIFFPDFKSLTWVLSGSSIQNLGVGKAAVGKSPVGGGGIPGSSTFESFFHERLRIYKYSRLILNITEESELPLELNWISLITKPLGRNTTYTTT